MEKLVRFRPLSAEAHPLSGFRGGGGRDHPAGRRRKQTDPRCRFGPFLHAPSRNKRHILLSLDRFRGLEAVDKERRLVTVRAGTKLKELGELLHGHGLAQENLGDINAQSIAGAISTGTHGTGTDFGILSTQVAALTLVNARGRWSNAPRTEIRSCSRRRRFPSAPWG